MNIPLLVSPQWLHDNLDNPLIGIIENSFLYESYHKAHIRGAGYVPGPPYLKKIDANGERTQYVMGAEEFLSLCDVLGLCRDKHYIVYDDYFSLYASRFWAVCRHFGVRNISLLDGSWRGWLDQGRPVSARMEQPASGSDIVIDSQAEMFITLDELQQIYDSSDIQLWDTRRLGEYNGRERTDNRRQGHMPGALNLDWVDLLDEPSYEGGPRFFKPLDVIEGMLDKLGLRRDKTIITYCQSGNRAALCSFVLELLNFPSHRLYDASMGEWANLIDTPLV